MLFVEEVSKETYKEYIQAPKAKTESWLNKV